MSHRWWKTDYAYPEETQAPNLVNSSLRPPDKACDLEEFVAYWVPQIVLMILSGDPHYCFILSYPPEAL
ncbi:MAG: hypothetical protein J7J65_00950 [Candidatus Korarchaeota archaeon]|nr:hypothetical protein [Candidatus Korarchaeota archaeon]